jgi:hypothetical protein
MATRSSLISRLLVMTANKAMVDFPGSAMPGVESLNQLMPKTTRKEGLYDGLFWLTMTLCSC